MKILYDYQILRSQRYGGISRYFYELTSRVSKREGCKVNIKCIGNINYYFGKKKKIPKFYNFFVIEKGFNYINKFAVLKKAKKHFDIFHPTYYLPYMVGKKHPKMIITVYDMIHEIFPELFLDNTIVNKKKVVYEADHIIAISESTKRDILRFYPDINEDKISVIYIGTDMQKCTDFALRDKFPKKYILFVGVRKGYKNFNMFVQSVIPILEKYKDMNVVCTGGGKFTDEELTSMGKYADRFIQINCDDEMLSAAYTFATLFVFPSKYEGFGIPTLEAFACDCPVVLSNSSSMPEVGGDAALYFDPNSAKDLTDKIQMLLVDEKLKIDLINKGKIQAKKQEFNWDYIADQTFLCYEKIVSDKRKL